jgi:hypothetical protein
MNEANSSWDVKRASRPSGEAGSYDEFNSSHDENMPFVARAYGDHIRVPKTSD